MTGQNAISPWNHTPLSSRLSIEYPIIQGPLDGLPSQWFLMKSLSGVAEKAERPELVPIWAGQSADSFTPQGRHDAPPMPGPTPAVGYSGSPRLSAMLVAPRWSS